MFVTKAQERMTGREMEVCISKVKFDAVLALTPIV